MKLNFFTSILRGKPNPETKVISVTSERTRERTLLGLENFLGSIAVPEPFYLEIAGDAAGVTLLVRCRDDSFVREQLGVHYRHARVSEVIREDAPLHLAEGEQAWSMDLRLRGRSTCPGAPSRTTTCWSRVPTLASGLSVPFPTWSRGSAR